MEKNTALETLTTNHGAAMLAELARDMSAIAARDAGATWSEIGDALGITKQRAQQRYSGEDRARIERRAAAADKGRQEGERILADIRERVWGTRAETSKIVDPDVAGDSVTPSIFLEPIAPAKPAKKIRVAKYDLDPHEDPRPSFWLPSAGFKDGTAQPGTGKGPHQCPKCGSTNHKGRIDEVRAWPAECKPTKYDPQDITDWINTHYPEGLTK